MQAHINIVFQGHQSDWQPKLLKPLIYGDWRLILRRKIVVTSTVYSESGKQTLGENIESFIHDRSAWPESLKDYYAGIPAENRKRGLTLDMLLDWMAEETGFTELVDPFYRSSFKTLLGRYKNWAYKPESSAGESVMLITAIAHCGIVRDGSGVPVTDPKELVLILFGRGGTLGNQ